MANLIFLKKYDVPFDLDTLKCKTCGLKKLLPKYSTQVRNLEDCHGRVYECHNSMNYDMERQFCRWYGKSAYCIAKEKKERYNKFLEEANKKGIHPKYPNNSVCYFIDSKNNKVCECEIVDYTLVDISTRDDFGAIIKYNVRVVYSDSNEIIEKREKALYTNKEDVIQEVLRRNLENLFDQLHNIEKVAIENNIPLSNIHNNIGGILGLISNNNIEPKNE